MLRLQPHTAYALIRGPRGEWSLSDAPDSTEIVGVETAREIPTPRVVAKVTGRACAERCAGSSETVVRATGSGSPRCSATATAQDAEAHRRPPERPLFATGKLRGKRRFVPSPIYPGRHALCAQVVRRGSPVESVKVDTYRAALPKPHARPRHIHADLIGHTVEARWRAVRGARSYVAVLEDRDGSISLPKSVRKGRRQVKFVSPPTKRRMKVNVFAVGRQGATSKAGHTSFRARGEVKSPREAARELLDSVEVLGDGDLLGVAPCPARGHCMDRLVVVLRGRPVGEVTQQVVPDSGVS